MNNKIKINRLREKFIKDINKELLKRGGLFENAGQNQLRKFEEILKSDKFGSYYINKLYDEVDILRDYIYKIDDKYFIELKGGLK